MIAAVVAALVLLGSAGCGDDPETAVSDPGRHRAPAPTTTLAPPVEDAAQPTSPEPGVGQDVRSRQFDRAELSADGTEVDVYFYGGVQECYVLDRVDIDRADPATVELTLYEGTRPGGGVCIDLAVAYVTTVALEPPAPAGAVVVDGVDGQVKS